MQAIPSAVQVIDERYLQIAAASEQQAHVARGVDNSLKNIGILAIQSNEGAQRRLDASTELSQLAVSLNQLVRRFQI